MLVIGICGGIGSGKSYVSQLIKRYGFPIINSDEVYRELCVSNTAMLNDLSEEFGNNVIDENGALNRKELAKTVFTDNKKLERLNIITHPYVKNAVSDLIENYKKQSCKAVFLEVPLMFESGFDKLCDYLCSVVCNTEKRIARVIRRDGCSKEDALLRINSQHDDEFYITHSDYVICNDGIADVNEQLLTMFKLLGI